MIQRVNNKDERPTPPKPPLEHPGEAEAWVVATRCWERGPAQRWQIPEVSAELRRCAVKARQIE